jgi:hypothetical protein
MGRQRLRQLFLEQLEDRRVLATASVIGGMLVFNNDGVETNDLNVAVDGTDLVLRDSNNTIDADAGVSPVAGDPNAVTIPLASITDVEINTHQGSDTLTVDISGGDLPIPLTYDGGDGGFDTLVLAGGERTFSEATYRFDNASDGAVEIDGSELITYTGLEPITSTITATDVTLNYSTFAETITVTDAGGGSTTVNSTAGEITTFVDPTSTLTINAGDTGDDTIDIDSLAASYPASIVIDGGGGSDTININAAVSLGAGKNLSLEADSIVHMAAVTVGGAVNINQTSGNVGTIDINDDITADGNILIDGASIDTTGGALDAGGGVNLSATGNIIVGATITAAANLSGNAVKIDGDTDGNNVGDFTLDGAITATSDVGLNVDIDPPFNVHIDAAITATGDISIIADNDIEIDAVTIHADSDGTGGGKLTVSADVDLSGSGDLDAVAASTLEGASVLLEGANVLSGIVTADGGLASSNIDFIADDDITLRGTLTADADVAIEAGLTGGAGSILQNAATDILAGSIGAGGNVDLDAPTAVTLNGTIGSGAAIGGDVDINQNPVATTSDVDINGSIDSVGIVAINGDTITMADGTEIDSGASAIDLNASGDITISLLTTTSDVTADSTAGSILDTSDTAGNDIDAATAILNGATGVASAANPLETTLDNLEADGGSSGVWVDNTGDLEIGDISAQVGVTGDGNIDISAASSITVSELIDADGGTVALDATTISLGADIVTEADTVTITGNVLVGTDAEIDTTDNGGSSGGADVTITGTVDDTSAGTNSLTIDGGSFGDVDVQGATGTGTALASISISAERIAIDDVSTTGAQSFVSTFGVTVDGTTLQSSSAAGGGINVTGTLLMAQNGLLTISNDGAGNADDIFISGVQRTTGGGSSSAILLTTDPGADGTEGDVIINGDVGTAVAPLATATVVGNDILMADVFTSGSQSYDATVGTSPDITMFDQNLRVTSAGAGILVDGVFAFDLDLTVQVEGSNEADDITFTNTVNARIAGSEGLTIRHSSGTSGAGDVDFQGAVGTVTALDFFDIEEADVVTIDSVTTVGGSGVDIGSDSAVTSVTMADPSTVNAMNGADIDVDATGAIALSSLTTTGEVRVTTSAGAITDNTASEAANINAGAIALRASTGVGDAGADDDDIDIASSSSAVETALAATTTTGDIHISDIDGALDINTVDSLVGVSISTGGAGDEILIREGASGDFHVNEDVTNAGAGSITLFADGTNGTHDLLISGTVESTGGGDIVLLSYEDLGLFDAAARVITDGSGTIDGMAGRVFVFGGAPTLGDASNGDITMVSGSQYRTDESNITLTGTADVRLSIVNADADASGSAGTVIITADSDGGGGGSGGIIDDLATEAANIIGDAAALRAGNAIGDVVDIDTAVNTLAAHNTGAGGGQIRISNDVGGLLTIGTVDGLSGVTDGAAGGGITITNASPLTIADYVTASGSITLTATDTAALLDDDLTVDSGVTIEAMGATSDVTLTAGDDLTVSSGSRVAAGGKVTIQADPPTGDPDNIGAVIDVLGEIDTVMQGEILGGDDIDSILLDPDAGSSGGILINGEESTDDYTVQLGNLGGTVEIGDMNSDGTDTLVVRGTASAETVTIGAAVGLITSITSGTETVTFADATEFVDIETLGGADTINVTASAEAEIRILGGDPAAPTSPADTLNFTAPAGSTTTLADLGPDSGTIETSGFEDVIYDEIEDLDLAGGTGAIIVEGTAGDDVLEITATSADDGEFVLTSGGVPGPTITFTDATSFAFTGDDGSDELIINHPAASAFAPTGGITYDGEGAGGDSDKLTIVGGNATTVTHTFTDDGGSDDHQGTVDWDGTTLTYTGLEPIFDGMLAVTREFIYTSGAETVTLDDDVGAVAGISAIASTLAEAVDFANPIGIGASLKITVDSTSTGGAAGADMIHLTGLDAAFDADLEIDGDGDDDVMVLTGATDIGVGDFTLEAASFFFDTGSLTTTGGATIEALTGDIDTAGTNTADVTAASAVLVAGGGIIGDTAPIATDIGMLEASASGKVIVDEADGLEIGGIGTLVLGISAGGDVDILTLAAGDLTVSSPISNTGAGGRISLVTEDGSISIDSPLSASGTGAAGDGGPIVIDAGMADGTGSDISIDARVSTDNGMVTVTADDDIMFTTDGEIDTLSGSTAAVRVEADQDGAADTGMIDMADGSFIDAWGGDLVVMAVDDVTISLLDSSGLTTVTSVSGAILDTADGAGIDPDDVIGLGDVIFDSSTGVGTMANPIETVSTNLEAAAAGADIYVNNTGDLIIGDIGGGLGATVSLGGDIVITAASDIDVNEPIDSGGGAIMLGASEDINVNDTIVSDDGAAASGAITLSADENITFNDPAGADFGNIANAFGAGLVTLLADADTDNVGGITMADMTNDDSTVISAAGGDIDIDADDDVTLANLSTTADVTVDTAGSILDGGDTDSDIVAATAILNGGTGVATGANPLETMLDNLEADGGSSGVWVDNTGDLEIGIAASGQVGVTGNGNIAISAASSITVTETIDSNGGTVTLDATTDVNINASILSGGGAVTVLADNDITFNASGSIDTESGSPTVTLTADDGGAVGGGIDMTDGSSVDATGGAITATATDDITLALLTTTGAVTVTSSAGSILDTADTAGNDISAASAVLIAATDVGTLANPLETALANLEGVATSGNFYLDDTGTLTIGGIGATVGVKADDNIDISSTGDLTISETVESDNGGGSNSVMLETTSSTTTALDIDAAILTAGGDATVIADGRITFHSASLDGEIDTQTGSGDVVVTSTSDRIVDDNNDVDITADTALLTGGVGVGGGGFLETTVNNLEGTAGSDGFFVTNTGALTIGGVDGGVTGISASGGAFAAVSVFASSPLTVDEDVSGVFDVTLSADDDAVDTLGNEDDLTISATATVDSSGRDVILYGGDDVTLTAGSTVSAADNVRIEGDFGDADAAGSTINILGVLITATQAIVLGQGDADTINLSPEATSSGAVLLDGQGGADEYNVQLGNLGGAVSVDDQASEGTDELIVDGTTGADTITINDSQDLTISAGGESITFTANTETVDVRGGTGADTFNVTPSTTALIEILGGTPTSADPTPHDTLNYTTPPGQATTIVQTGSDEGTIESTGGGGHMDVDYDEIEDIDLAGAITVTGTGVDDELVITLDAADEGSYVLTTATIAGPTISFSGATSFTFNAGLGTDALEVDYTTCSCINSFLIDYNGEGGTGDELTLTGGAFGTVLTELTGADTGLIDLDNDTTVEIDYSGLSPVLMAMGSAADLIFELPPGATTAVLEDDIGIIGNTQLRSPGGHFETTTFINPTDSLTIRGGDGDDTIEVAGLDAAFDANLTIDSSLGADDVDVDITAATDIDDGADGQTASIGTVADPVTTIAFSAGSIDTTGGTINLNATGAISTTTAAADVSGADLVATTDGSIDLDTDVDTIDASVTGTSTIDLDESDAVELVDVDAIGGSITVDAGGTITATDVQAGGAGNVTLTATGGGDVLVDLVLAISDLLTITAAGAIEETNNDAAIDLDAELLILDAVDGIGDDDTIEIDAFGGSGDGLDAEVTGTGGIDLSDDDGTLRILSAITADGPITITGTSTMRVETVTAGGGAGDDVTLETDGLLDVEPGFAVMAADVIDLISNGDSIEINSPLTAGGDILVDSDGGSVTSSAAGDLDAGGGVEIGAFGVGGDVTLDGTVVADANTIPSSVTPPMSAVRIDAVDDVTINDTVTASSVGGLHVEMDAVDIDINADITATGELHLGSDSVAPVTATLSVDGTIDGAAEVDLIGTSITQVSGDILSGGDVLIDASPGAGTVDLDGTIGSGTPIGGSVEINQDPLSTNDDVDLDGTIDATVDILVAGATIDTGSGGDLDAGGGVSLTASGNITTGGTIDASANNVGPGPDAQADAVKIDSPATVTINAAITASDGGTTELHIDIDPVDVTVSADMSATGDIDITASNNVTVDTSATITADSDSDLAGTLTITADDATDADGVGDLDAQNGTSLLGNGVILSGDDVTVDVVTSSDNLVATAAEILTFNDTTTADDDIDGDGDTVVIASTANLLAGSNVELDGTSGVTVTGTIGAGTAIGGAVDINDNGGGGPVLFQTNGDVTADGSIFVFGSSITATAGTLASTAAGVWLTATGNITSNIITADGNSVNGATDAIKIDTDTGNVIVNGTLTATSDVNLNIDIDPVDVTVNANMTATGDIDITASNDIDVAATVTIEADEDDSGAGDLTIRADDDTASGGDLTAVNTSNLIGANVTLVGDNVTVDVVDAKTEDATITGAVNVTLNDDVSAGAGAGDSVTVDAVTGTLAQTAGNILAGEDVTLDAATAVDLDGTIGDTTAIGDDVSINTTRTGTVAIDGDVTADGAVSVGTAAGGAVTIGAAAATDITSDANMDAGAEDITILASASITQSTAGSELVSNSGGIFVDSVASTVTVISADSDGANQAAGTITVANAAGDAAIQIAADEDVTVSGIDASAGDVEVLSDTEDILLGDITATGFTVFLQAIGAGGEVIDDNADTAGDNVSALALAIDAEAGIGDGDALETAVSTFAADNGTGSGTAAGNIEIDNSVGGLLTIGTVGARVGVTNTDGNDAMPFGEVIITNASPMTVDDDVTSEGDITLTAIDDDDTGGLSASDDLTVSAGVSITADNTDDAGDPGDAATTAIVILNAGDDVVLAATSTISSEDTIAINVDNAASGGDADAGSAGEVTIGDTTTTDSVDVLTAPGGTTITGGVDIEAGDVGDIFNIVPQEASVITIMGEDPILPTTPGDTLNMDFTVPPLSDPPDLPPTLTVGVPGNGIYTFPVLSLLDAVNYFSIEDVAADGMYHLILDGSLPGSYGDNTIDDNDTADDILVTVDGTDLVLERTGPADPQFPTGSGPGAAAPTDFIGDIFRGDIGDILSLTIEGTGDEEEVTVSDVGSGGLPDFAGTIPTGENNPNVAPLPDMLFNGRGPDGGPGDSLVFSLTTATYNQIYAIGNGIGGGFGTDVGTAEGEIRTEVDGGGAELNLYFTGLEPITTSGTPGGTLTVIGDLESNLIEIIDADDASVGGPAGFTRVQAWNCDRDGAFPHRFSPYEFLDFAADAFTALVIEGLEGDDIVDLVSLDGAEGSLATIGIFGGADPDIAGDGDDILSTNTTDLPGNGDFDLTLDGGDGDNTYNIGSISNLRNISGLSADSLDSIGSTVMVVGGPGADGAVVNDSSDFVGHTFTITDTTVARDGLTVLDYTDAESLRVWSGSEADTVEIDSLAALPFVTSLQDAGSTDDLLDFTDFGAGIQLDLDTAAMQSLDADVAGGPLLQLLSTYENFTGTSMDDVVYVDPLTTAMRDLDGGSEATGDRLNFDGQGEAFSDDGATLTPPGGSSFMDVMYGDFESGQTTNGPQRFLDNGDAGYAAGGAFVAELDFLDRVPFDSDQDVAPIGSTDSATWSFSGLPRGVYLVSATWTKREARATNAAYSIHDGALTTDPLLATTIVDQRQDPSQLTDSGSEWQHLAIVEVTGTDLTVGLDATGADGDVVADAIRIEPVASGLIIDNGDTGFTSFAGGAPAPTLVSQSIFGLFNDLEYSEPAAGNTATWSFSGLADGRYLVSATWTPSDQNTQNARYTLDGGGGAGAPIFIDQELGPNDFTEATIAWENIGVVDVTGGVGTITVELSDAGGGPLDSDNNRVVADAIRVIPAPEVGVLNGVMTVPDDPNFFADVGTTRLGTNRLHTITVQNTGQSHLNLSALDIEGAVLNTFDFPEGYSIGNDFQATSVPPGGYTTFDIQLNALRLGTAIGTVSFETNDTDESTYEFATTGVVQRPPATIIDDGDAAYAPGTFLAGPKTEGYLGDVDYSFGGSSATATWMFTGLADGEYLVSATWPTGSLRTTVAPFTINGGTPIVVDQTVEPADFADNQYHLQLKPPRWENLDIVTVTGGTITVTLSDTGVPSSEIVIADAIRIVRAEPNVVNALDSFAVINNGDPGFDNSSCTDCQLFIPTSSLGSTPAFLDEFQYMTGDGSGDTVTWSLDLTQGVYEIAVSWHPESNRTTAAEYTIEAGVSDFTTFGTVDQSLDASADQLGSGVIFANGKPFQILTSSFVVPALSKSVTVSLSDEGGGFVIADAVLARRVGGLPQLAEGTPAAGSDAEAVVTDDMVGPLVSAAAARWEAAGVEGVLLDKLRSVEVVISDLADNRLGLASEFDGVITIDVNAAGFGWFTDATPGVDEEFVATVHAAELAASAGGPADGRIDLLSVLIHEMGHVAGLADLASDTRDVMAGGISAGLRRVLEVSTTTSNGHTNPTNALDVDDDGFVVALDALLVINALNMGGSRPLDGSTAEAPYLDTSEDGWVSSLDVLLVINEVNARSGGAGEAIADPPPVLTRSLATTPAVTKTLDAIGMIDLLFADAGRPFDSPASRAEESVPVLTDPVDRGTGEQAHVDVAARAATRNETDADYATAVDDLLADLGSLESLDDFGFFE